MNRIKNLFKKEGNKLVVFLTAGFPQKESTEDLVLEAINGGADMIEINSKNPGNPFFLLTHPGGSEEIDESTIALLTENATSADFRLKVRSEHFWTEAQ